MTFRDRADTELFRLSFILSLNFLDAGAQLKLRNARKDEAQESIRLTSIA